ncbi:MAG: 50S ribosomal protein L22 [Candidatus Kapabacteria bacterium]|jgi:large subunit ribosomal protein L22|nr:50S ribosomal protein L22 [Candidatus Kapabacteria bacterium]
MEAKALKRYIPSSPLKMRLVIDMIRGKNAAEAINMLRFSPKHAARVAEKVLRSAISNLNVKAELNDIAFNEEDIFVKIAYVNGGPAAKRVLPAPMGRAYRIKKRSNHLTIIVATPDEKVTKSPNESTIKE